ncbi:hypothetical protein UA08_00131 [Talaromyces atroroseus]|uniref:SWR1-complex protein 3 domain-containing protein n=1 Tax=Talaromyces atroroseus TaxID=1441469 RepID=A0A225B1I4_TALAT|nr:hypothetical protein UA08_00131 [Talaromyces atroroseus]OKL64564.1 hypothetical protein UA08_00131 [Talaromyces atroroseus]
MAPKRKLPARERREPAAKRRVSEAASQSSSRRKTSTPATAAQSSTPIPEPERQSTPEPIEEPLPTKLKEGDPLPTRSKPQSSLTLSDNDFQSIAESVVLSMSLERSKKKWLSDGIFERYWTKPKKTKREQLEGKNPPKDSMTKVGPCKIIIEPHHFDGMIYTVKDPNAKPAVQIPPPQRIVQYGPPPTTGYQYQHYAPPQQMRPPPYPYNQPPNPQNAPSHPRPQQPPPTQRQQPTSQAQGPPPQPAKPSPDPVIQMLATRAASNPELKALMRIVASSKASQEQLRIFQGHIDELNAIIRQREEQQRRQQQQQQNNYYQQPQQVPQSQQPQNTHAPPPAQQVAPKPPQQNSQQPQKSPVPAPSSAATPAQSSTSDLASTPAPANSAAKAQSPTQPSQAPIPTPANNPGNAQPHTAPSAGQSGVPNASDSTPNTTPQIKTEPGTPATLAPAPAAPPAPTPSAVTPANTVPKAPAPVPVPPSAALVATAPSSGPSYVPQASPVTNPVPTNPSPQPLSPYPAGPSQYPQYHHPPYPHVPPPIKARSGPQYSSSTYYQTGPAPPPPKPPIKAVVFEFTSPLTPYGSSTSGHAGSGDRYLFPEYSILEYQAGGTVLLASFLLVRKVEPNTKFPLEQTPDIAPKSKSKSSKSKKKDKEKAAEKGGPSTPAPEVDSQAVDEKKENNAPGTSTADEKKPAEEGDNKTPLADTTAAAQPKKVDAATNLKEYYQPLTMRFYSSKPAILEPLSRIVKPAAEVRKYMEEVMERAERAPAGFLPFRLPREKPLKAGGGDADDHDAANEVTVMAEDAKSKTSDRHQSTAAASEVDDMAVADDGKADLEAEELELLLKDFYEPPNGLVPIRV